MKRQELVQITQFLDEGFDLSDDGNAPALR